MIVKRKSRPIARRFKLHMKSFRLSIIVALACVSILSILLNISFVWTNHQARLIHTAKIKEYMKKEEEEQQGHGQQHRQLFPFSDDKSDEAILMQAVERRHTLRKPSVQQEMVLKNKASSLPKKSNESSPSFLSSPSVSSSSSSSPTMPLIPHHLVLLDTRYDSFFDIPSPLQDNMHNTIEKFLNLWDDHTPSFSSQTFKSHYDKIKAMVESSQVWYLNNTECENAIYTVAPDLLQHFQNERKGSFKANVCRVAALYLRGGYYLDTDMVVVKAPYIEPDISFLSPWEAPYLGRMWGIFNSFIAIAPKHPLLLENIEQIRAHYRIGAIRRRFTLLMGTKTLYQSFIKFYGLDSKQAMAIRNGKLKFSFVNNGRSMKEEETNHFVPTGESRNWKVQMTLLEQHLPIKEYENYPVHENVKNKRGLCDYVVHDSIKKEIFFYSRIVGCDFCPMLYKIPRRTIFIEPSVESLSELPSKKVDNMNVIKKIYGEAWDADFKKEYHGLAEILRIEKILYHKPTWYRRVDNFVFLGDSECQELLKNVEPLLLPYYINEKSNDRKRHICRASYLFDRGGYYFDMNSQMTAIVDPNNIDSDVSYIQPLSRLSTKARSSSDDDSFALSESFMAVAAKHPLLRLEIESLVEFYTNRGNKVVEDDDQKQVMISVKGKKVQGDKSLMRALEDFYARDKQGINVEYWDLDLYVHPQKTADLQS